MDLADSSTAAQNVGRPPRTHLEVEIPITASYQSGGRMSASSFSQAIGVSKSRNSACNRNFVAAMSALTYTLLDTLEPMLRPRPLGSATARATLGRRLPT